jgi:FkbM family methyltransferase
MENLILKDFGEHQMYLIKNDDGISRTLNKKHGYNKRELAFMTLIRENVEPGQVCFDVGANIGFVTLILAKLVGKDGTVYAVEPTKQNYKVLKKNIRLNGYENNIFPKRLAVSNKMGNATLYLSGQSNLSSLSKHSKTDPGRKEQVNTVTIDEYLKDKKIPDMYKMDIEGHEVKVLNGMHETATKSLPGTKIFMEVHPKLYGKKLDMEDALKRFVKLGFKFKYVVSAAVAQPKLFKKRGYEPTRVFNVSGWQRGIYENISTEDAIYFCSYPHKEHVPEKNKTSPKIVRYIILEKI